MHHVNQMCTMFVEEESVLWLWNKGIYFYSKMPGYLNGLKGGAGQGSVACCKGAF